MNKYNSPISIIAFLFFPFVGFLTACINLKNKWNSLVFILFYGLFGYCHTFQDIRADSYRKFLDFSDFNVTSLSAVWNQYVLGTSLDIYQDSLWVIIKYFTNSPNIMMMIVGLIGGYWTMLVMRRVLDDYKGKFNILIYIIFLFILLRFNPALMGGLRNFTALPLFAYSAIKFLIDRKNIWLIGLLVTPFIHFGYIFYVFATIFIRVIQLKRKILFWPVIVACIASTMIDTSVWSGMIDRFNSVISNYNESVSSRATHYGEAETDILFASSVTTQIMDIQSKISACFMIVLLFYIKRNWRRLNMDSYTSSLYDIMLFFLLVGYICCTFSVVGQRYLHFGLVLLYLFLLNLYQQNRKSKIESFILIMPIVYVFNIAWLLYNCYCNTGWELYVLPFPAIVL